jgi:hypothetical protein
LVNCNKIETQVTPARQPVFKRGKRMSAIAVLLPVKPIVKAEDLSGMACLSLLFVQFVFGVHSDLRHPPNQPFTGLVVAPVSRNQRPHHDVKIELSRDAREPGIADTERRTKPFGRLPGRELNSLVASPQLVSNLRLSKPEKIRVRFGVIANGMPARGNLSDELRTLPHKSANQEKCGVRVVSFEQIQELRGDGRIRPVVKRDGKSAR